MIRKTLLGLAVFAFAFGGLGLSAVSAAPNGKTEQGNGRSICYFSGLNDDPESEIPLDGGQVQSFGQLVKQVGPNGIRAFAEAELGVATVGVPGIECNPNTGPDLKPKP